MDLADYLDGPHGWHGGGGHHGGGWHHGGGHWGGGGPIILGPGPYWEPPPAPVYVVEQTAPSGPPQYVGIPAYTAPSRCSAQIAPALWRCGNTTYYDVSRYELRANGLVARGGLGTLPVLPAPTLPGPRMPTLAPSTPAPSAPIPPPPAALTPFSPPAGMMIAPPGTCATLGQWLAWNPNPAIMFHPGEDALQVCIGSQTQNADGTWSIVSTISGSLPAAGTGVMTPLPTQTTTRQDVKPFVSPIAADTSSSTSTPSTSSGGLLKLGLGLGALWALSRMLR